MAFKWEPKFTKIVIIVGIIIAILFFTVGCSTTKEVSTRTEEYTTIQPITVTVPPISGVIPNIILAKPDTVNDQPFGVYIGSGNIATKDSITGKVTNTKTKVTVTVKKNHAGKPIADVRIEAQQDPIRTEAKVTNSKITTDTKTTTTPFLITVWDDIKWWILDLLLLLIGTFFLLKKFFPTLTKTWIKL